jgi:hypothetical protein
VPRLNLAIVTSRISHPFLLTGRRAAAGGRPHE